MRGLMKSGYYVKVIKQIMNHLKIMKIILTIAKIKMIKYNLSKISKMSMMMTRIRMMKKAGRKKVMKNKNWLINKLSIT
jgi:hypothetical protein